jgi:hypothetical protein
MTPLKLKHKDVIDESDFHIPEFISGISQDSDEYKDVLEKETNDLAQLHAQITKDVAVGFYEWCKNNEFYECTREQRDIPTEQLFDIYAETL